MRRRIDFRRKSTRSSPASLLTSLNTDDGGVISLAEMMAYLNSLCKLLYETSPVHQHAFCTRVPRLAAPARRGHGGAVLRRQRHGRRQVPTAAFF